MSKMQIMLQYAESQVCTNLHFATKQKKRRREPSLQTTYENSVVTEC